MSYILEQSGEKRNIREVFLLHISRQLMPATAAGVAMSYVTGRFTAELLLQGGWLARLRQLCRRQRLKLEQIFRVWKPYST